MSKKLKLTEPGFTSMTGSIGEYAFENGVSVGEIPTVDARRIAANMRCEYVDGSNPSAAGVLVTGRDVNAEVTQPMERAKEIAEVTKSEDEPKEKAPKYSREQLENIADKGGISALREIAEPLGIKGRSISELIETIASDK